MRGQSTIEIHIGNQTAFSAPSIMEPFDYAVANGFDAFEWFPDKKETGEGWMAADLDQDTRAFVKRVASEHDIRLSVHAPWQANPLDPHGRDLLLRHAEFAQDVGASVLNVHACLHEGVEAYVQAVGPLLEDLRGVGIALSIENTPLTSPEELNDLFRRLRPEETSVQVGMCLDLGHANLCAATRNDYLRFVDTLGSHVPIIHIHLHENYGDSDSHLPLFTGPAGRDPSGIMGLIDRLKARRFQGSIILEQWPNPPERLKEARDRLLRLLGNPPTPPFGKGGREPPHMQKDGAGNEGASEDPTPKREMPPHDLPPSEKERSSNPPPLKKGGRGGFGEFAAMVATGNEENRSWREKLGFVYDLLTDETIELDPGRLTTLAVYLRFVGTGEIPSLEEGGHHRPSHHARMAGRIHDRLTEITTSENRFIVRRIYPWLPSFDSLFTSAEPLTRIRDIAHRNDIPHELKEEIKHTLQNKLHRNAGPEDLATSRALLERFTAAGADLPEAFVNEFRKFHEELKEFFNARSLEQDLEAQTIREEVGPELVRAFLKAKEGKGGTEDWIEALELLTAVRTRLAEGLGKKGPEAQQLQITDIRMEDYSFVLLSRLAGRLDPQGEASDWARGIRCVVPTLAGLRLSGFDEEECRAMERELVGLQDHFDPRSPEDLLRLKAVLERAFRLAAGHTDRILSLFPGKAEELGAALQIPEHAVRVFAEAEIRRHPLFQLSKIVSLFLKEIRKRGGLPPWDRIVSGKVRGLMTPAPGLRALSEVDDPSLVGMIDQVDGEEEIPEGVVAIVVSQEVPHLSHLAVRARQRGVVFVVCEDKDLFEEFRALSGKRVLVDASGESVRITENGEGEQVRERPAVAGAAVASPVEFSPVPRILPLGEVTLGNGGGKAHGARTLEELSKRKGADFDTPAGLVIPFGVMEEALRRDPGSEKTYRSLLRKLPTLSGEEFDRTVRELRRILVGTEVPEEILSGIVGTFPPHERLMVRSSSNCEDLAEISGAGLYESVAAVSPPHAASAVRQVWGSLWTRRAALSRTYSGIPHEDAHMAVLVQRMILPEYSFILHTVEPLSGDPDLVYMEFAVGLGETLASAQTPGTPYRMIYDKRDERVRTLSFASFSLAVWPEGKATVDYSQMGLSTDSGFRARLGARIGRMGRFVEKALGTPQDMEGVFRDDTLYLVQSRPQQGVSNE